MVYRQYNKETDYDQVMELCMKNKIMFPHEGSLNVAVDNNGIIKGILGVKLNIYLEPLISENPMAAVKLFTYAIKAIKDLGAKQVRLLCSSTKKELYKKVGFYQIEDGKIIMEKEIR